MIIFYSIVIFHFAYYLECDKCLQDDRFGNSSLILSKVSSYDNYEFCSYEIHFSAYEKRIISLKVLLHLYDDANIVLSHLHHDDCFCCSFLWSNESFLLTNLNIIILKWCYLSSIRTINFSFSAFICIIYAISS